MAVVLALMKLRRGPLPWPFELVELLLAGSQRESMNPWFQFLTP